MAEMDLQGQIIVLFFAIRAEPHKIIVLYLLCVFALILPVMLCVCVCVCV